MTDHQLLYILAAFKVYTKLNWWEFECRGYRIFRYKREWVNFYKNKTWLKIYDEKKWITRQGWFRWWFLIVIWKKCLQWWSVENIVLKNQQSTSDGCISSSLVLRSGYKYLRLICDQLTTIVRDWSIPIIWDPLIVTLYSMSLLNTRSFLS